MSNYSHPQTLVSTQWVEEHKNDENVRIVEVDKDCSTFERSHIENAIPWDWRNQLCDPVKRDLIGKEDFENLLGNSGITNNTTIILYGDTNNWFAAWAFWQLKIYGHNDVRLLNGGRKKWLLEGRKVTNKLSVIKPVKYICSEYNLKIRAFLPQVESAINNPTYVLIDVRSYTEYKGKDIPPSGIPEKVQRCGHIPNSINIPWDLAVNADGTFKSKEELEKIYYIKGISPNKKIITYCSIGERASFTWYVLKYLLGFPDVANYDGSWTEWGNMVGQQIEIDEPEPTPLH